MIRPGATTRVRRVWQPSQHDEGLTLPVKAATARSEGFARVGKRRETGFCAHAHARTPEMPPRWSCSGPAANGI